MRNLEGHGTTVRSHPNQVISPEFFNSSSRAEGAAYLYARQHARCQLMLGFTCLVLVAVWLNCIQAVYPLTHGPQGVNLWRLNVDPQRQQRRMRSTQRPDPAASREDAQQALFDYRPGTLSKKYDFRAQWFEQPLDHFDKSSKLKFHQRYWVNSRHYNPREGAPVIVLDSGETSGEVCLNSNRIGRFADALAGSPAFLGHRHC